MDSVPVPQGDAAVSRPSLSGSRADEPRAANVRARTDRDLELMAQVARGDIDATELLAERMAPRALRVARSLMVGTDDAGDAALHALIELLRSHARYRGQQRLERWADRVMALSVVRFARAVRRRDQPALAQGAPNEGDTGELSEHTLRVDERSARTFEQYLTLLPELSRQILLLRHGLGFALGELSDALQCSLPVAREQLRVARRDMRSLVRRKSDGAAAVLGQGAQRWCVLRDREALGESLAPDEHEELTRLEARDPEVWAFVAQVRALELFFEAARETPQSGAEHELAARSVAALEISSPTLRPRELAPVTDTGPDFEGSRWVRRVAVGSSIALAAASVVALWLYNPPAAPELDTRTVRAPARGAAQYAAGVGAAEPVLLQPTVEALPTARTAARGAKLRSAGRVLSEGTLLAQGDSVETSDRPGCLQIAPDSELCLAPMTQLRLSSLQPRERRIELLAGRVVVRIGPLSEATRWLLRVDQVEVQAARAVFSVERLPDGKLLRVRTLRANVELRVGEVGVPVAEAKSASLRLVGGPVDAVALFPSQAQRDWELLATGLYPTPSAVPTPTKGGAAGSGGGTVAPSPVASAALHVPAEAAPAEEGEQEDSEPVRQPGEAAPASSADETAQPEDVEASPPPPEPASPEQPGPAQRAVPGADDALGAQPPAANAP